MNTYEFCKRIERECGDPFLPKNFVRVVQREEGIFALVIGDRALWFDGNGEFTGTDTGVGDGKAWIIEQVRDPLV